MPGVDAWPRPTVAGVDGDTATNNKSIITIEYADEYISIRRMGVTDRAHGDHGIERSDRIDHAHGYATSATEGDRR